ncbi:hypothetical protein [Agrobacterium tumefaciens]|uniref:Right-handed parallel beta-helix repeat-containing protein n=1 Tax=Agrobacterium tumefaciens TaxID=358 RepID=A0A2L2LBS4_AGRTU|nr:hypothetical protein [Agrobacterium tumefaciens]AVH41805.1 hypothetical protein At1D1609_17510 [Agrobacterium tumefaciens]NSY95725.1 hypothetical protein [Agrobacterium tumefaciens]
MTVPLERQKNIADVAPRIRTLLGLGSAATEESSAFATASQGEKADQSVDADYVDAALDAAIAAIPIGISSYSSVSAIAAIDTTLVKTAYLDADGRSGIFSFKAGDYTAKIASDPRNGVYIKADAISASLGAWVRQDGWALAGVNVDWFGTVGGGVADDTVAIQAALDFGYDANFGRNSYKASYLSVVNDYQNIRGCGRETLILDASTSADLFLVGDGTNQIVDVTLSDFRVWAADGVTKSAGCVVHSRYGSRINIRNVYAGALDDYTANGNETPLWDGFWFDKFNECMVSGGQVVVANDGIKANGLADGSWGAEITIGDNVRILHGNIAIHIGGGAGGIYLNRIDVSACYRGLLVDKALAAVKNRELFVSTGCIIDSCRDWGVVFDNDSVALVNFKGWSASNGTATNGGNAGGGILALPSTGVQPKINLTGSEVYNNKGDGIRAASGKWVIGGACKIINNGTGTLGGCGFIAEDEAVSAIIVGNMIADNGKPVRGTGVAFTEDTNYSYNVSDNDLRGNGVAGFSSSASPSYSPSRIVKDNLGHVTEARGRASGTTDASGDLTITHGMNGTPASVIPQLSSAAFVGSVQMHTPTATTFKLRFFNSSNAAMPSAAVQADWRAEL